MIYADENVWLPVVEGLRRRGWDVTTAREEDTIGDEDEAQLRYAAARGWVVLTFDDDFLGLVETEFVDIDHAGVIYVPQYGNGVGELVRRVDSTLERNADRDLTDEVLYA
ncbi:DUF5615 family PIN-like protein [Halorarum halobium]|uniref:DUF5615 family PIN-like protein n=1 Tax=Halorarum halobium TaxID=3075121 RepID=UPI0028AC610E|nr:DUF5615 family PIN-like protein [Halobaculum sp. XH14]